MRGPGAERRSKLEAQHEAGGGCSCCNLRPLIPRPPPAVADDDDGT